jgi:hypothetical protein
VWMGGDREPRQALGAKLRAMLRWFLRHQPEAILVLCGALILIPLLLDFIPGTSSGLDEFEKHHEVGVHLIEHLAVAAFVAAAAYYYVLGVKRRQALRNYRRACEKPEKLVEWSRATLQGVRRDACESLGDALIDSREPAVAVVRGRAGMSRTSFVIELVEYLAKRGQIPIPLVAPPDGTFRLETLAKQKFCEHMELGISSDAQADAIWHRARHTRGIVLLVDGVESELIAKLQANDGRAFASALEELKANRIAVVVATTGELPVDDIGPLLREDLDRISYEGAVSYLKRQFAPGPEVERAITALEKVHDPRDGAPVEPFYLDLIARLRRAEIDLEDLPAQADRWRFTLLERYVAAVASGVIQPRPRPHAPDERAPERPGSDAERAAELVASKLQIPSRLAVKRRGLKLSPGQLEDAADLSLLRYGALTVGFASDDLGAYLVARQREGASLLADVEQLGAAACPDPRHDRFALNALTFWHLRRDHGDDEAREVFSALLTLLEASPQARPRFVAAAVRIASACPELQMFDARVVECASRCVEELRAGGAGRRDAGDPRGPARLVRALGRWSHPSAPELLWRAATSRNEQVETPAAKALIAAEGDPAARLHGEIERVLASASRRPEADLSKHGSELGNEVAVLAWVLPALRPASPESMQTLERQYEQVKRICLSDRMIELRGEMALAQGLKLAIINAASLPADAAERNAVEVKALLDDRRLRFWHARLVLVQALLAYAWDRPERASETRSQLAALRAAEPHRLTKRGIELSLQGLRSLARSSRGAQPRSRYRYMWRHEGEAVTAVEQGGWKVSRLAADVVLVSNMLYRLWEVDDGANGGRSHLSEVAEGSDLPPCIRDCSRRKSILPNGGHAKGCDCGWSLCGPSQPPAVTVRWGVFSESFCREQARLAEEHGPPTWARKGPIRRRSDELAAYWEQAAHVAAVGAVPPVDVGDARR